MEKRIDTASKLIRASPGNLYEAHLDPMALAAWLPPRGMRATSMGSSRAKEVRIESC
jgi:uncharacterized protein YndB with AHSA1/START domain